MRDCCGNTQISRTKNLFPVWGRWPQGFPFSPHRRPNPGGFPVFFSFFSRFFRKRLDKIQNPGIYLSHADGAKI
jgi:hypothetical protein